MEGFGWKRKASLGTTSASGFGKAGEEEVEEEEEPPRKKQMLALEDPSSKAKRLRQEGIVLAEDGVWWGALGRWGAAAALTPADHTLHDMMAQAYMQVDELSSAVASASRAAQLAPLWWAAQQTRGRALLGVGELGAAIRCFSRALRLRPQEDEVRRDDLRWAHKLLQTYRSIQKETKEVEKKTDELTEASEEETRTGPQIEEVTDDMEEETPSPTKRVDPTYVEPRPRRSTSSSTKFVSCCHKKGEGREGAGEGECPLPDLSNMVCLRPPS